MSNFKESVTEPGETLFEQKAQLLISLLFELAPTSDMIILTMRRLRDEIVSLFLSKGQCDPAVTHYLEKGDQGQKDSLGSILKWLYPNGYDIISQPLTKTTYSQNTSRPTYFCTQCPENLNMMHTQGGAIRSDQGSELGRKTVGIQD